MHRSSYPGIIQKAFALIAIVFGVLTIFVGSRVLSGWDPGYVVFLPLLIYNTVMGFAYFAVGVIAWRGLDPGRKGAGVIFLLNLLVLVAIAVFYASGGAVAIDSLRAMTLRTVVWLVIFLGLWWLSRRGQRSELA